MTVTRKWLPIAAVAVTATLFTIANVIAYRGSYAGTNEDLFSTALTVALLAFPVVGAILVRHHPDNAIGWMFCAVGPLFGVMHFSDAYVENHILYGTTGRFADLVLWIGVWTGPIAYTLITAFLMLLFPSGRLLSPRWRPVARLAAGSIVVMVLASMVRPRSENYPQLINPYGIGGAFGRVIDAVAGLGWIAITVSVLLAVVSLIIRFRRSRGIERQQMKWMVSSASFLLIAQFTWWISGSVAPFMTGLAFLAIPISVCIAILRYRLYEIDVIINRTLVYGVLTATLLLSYLLVVVTLSRILDPVTRDSDVAVAASTLTVAALFRPLRGRIQRFIDRRFYRSKYDAGRALALFSVRLRNEIEVDTVRTEMLGIVGRTLQPVHASLWVREPS